MLCTFVHVAIILCSDITDTRTFYRPKSAVPFDHRYWEEEYFNPGADRQVVTHSSDGFPDTHVPADSEYLVHSWTQVLYLCGTPYYIRSAVMD